MASCHNVCFVDVEMTSLDANNSDILEVGMVFVNESLVPLERVNIVISHSRDYMNSLSGWHQTTFGDTLLKEVVDSKISYMDAEYILCGYFDKHRQGRKMVLAGSSVGFDRLVLLRHFPSLESRIHHRIIDVSSIMECTRRFVPNIFKKCPRVHSVHRALGDAEAALTYLKYYRDNVFKGDTWEEGDLFTNTSR